MAIEFGATVAATVIAVVRHLSWFDATSEQRWGSLPQINLLLPHLFIVYADLWPLQQQVQETGNRHSSNLNSNTKYNNKFQVQFRIEYRIVCNKVESHVST